MRFTRHSLVRLILIQILSSLAFCVFVYMQMSLISNLEERNVNGHFALMTVGVLGLLFFLELLETYIRGRSYEIFSVEIKERIARKFLTQSAQNHREKSDEEHISFFANKVNTVMNQYFYIGLYGIKLLIQCSITFITLLVISWQCGLLVTAEAVSFGLVIRFMSKKLTSKQQNLLEKKAAFVDTLIELHEGYEEIHLSQMESLAEENFFEDNKALEQTEYDYRLTQLGIETLGIGQNMLIYILILIVGGTFVYSDRTGLGVFVSAAELSVQILNQWSLFSRIIVKMKAVEPLKKELDAYLEIVNPSEILSQNDENILLEVRNICFRYEPEICLLEDVNLVIQKGKKYLITGESGGGKSTFLEILMGHKECQAGDITKSTSRIAYIPQEPFLFKGSLRQNIAFDKEVDDAELYCILNKLDLELSLDEIVEEGGVNLSGGQRARVVLARILLIEPELLIMDELTANMDRKLGEKIEEMLLTEYPQMSLCAVAHRTYCLEKYDVHLKLSSGRMQEVIMSKC